MMGITTVRSFIVRIYRATKNRPEHLLGVVEEVGKEEKRAFHTMEELWGILNPRKRREVKGPGKGEIASGRTTVRTKKNS